MLSSLVMNLPEPIILWLSELLIMRLLAIWLPRPLVMWQLGLAGNVVSRIANNGLLETLVMLLLKSLVMWLLGLVVLAVGTISNDYAIVRTYASKFLEIKM